VKFGLLLTLVFLGTAPARSDVVTLGAAKDNSILQKNPNNSNGGAPGLYVGTDGDTTSHRSLISFSLNGIPTGATITNVQLTLTLGTVAGAGGGGGTEPPSASIGLFDLAQNWGEGTAGSTALGIATTGGGFAPAPGDATWNAAFFQQTSWTSAGGDHAAAASASLFLDNNTTGSAFTWLSTPQLVADVQGWLDQPATNFGWELINADETDPRTFFAFYSREWSTFAGGLASQEPALQVTFTVPEPAAGAFAAMAGLAILSRRPSRRRRWV
jgi:hypothetical protein